ncbi:MAG: hypothetical protein M5U28_12170 [Sandaracinaceae bacterium]|nr:hypothetical protein [Sandaracinaceae bacterium]
MSVSVDGDAGRLSTNPAVEMSGLRLAGPDVDSQRGATTIARVGGVVSAARGVAPTDRRLSSAPFAVSMALMASCALSHDPGDAGRDAGTAPAPLAEIEVGLGTDAVPAYGQQDAPVVAWTGSGFYAAWLDRLGGSEAESQIRAAHLDRFGRMTAPPRALVDGSSLNEPRIALASAGELRVVAWIEEGLRVRAVRVGSDGEPMDPAPLLLRENESSGFLSRSFIASDGRDALVGWVHSGAVELVRVPAGALRHHST